MVTNLKSLKAKPLVSILIPAFNADKWITETLRSAIAQTWDRREIIVVDDGSTDKTLALARQFESDSVHVVAQENQGAAAARNKALSLSQGDYIQWLDADDLLAPEKISLQMEQSEIERDDLMLYTSAWGRFYFRAERARFCPDSLWCDLKPVEWLVTKFEKGVWMNPAAWLVSRRSTELAGPWDGRLSFSGDDDGEYMCRLVARSRAVKFVQDARCYYRIGNTSGLSWRRSDTALDSFFLATTLCINHLRSLEDSERTRAAGVRFLQKRLRYFYPLKPAIIQAATMLASDLGGTLAPPSMSRRFRLVSQIVGWKLAMRAKSKLWTMTVLGQKQRERLIDLMYGLRDVLTVRHS